MNPFWHTGSYKSSEQALSWGVGHTSDYTYLAWFSKYMSSKSWYEHKIRPISENCCLPSWIDLKLLLPIPMNCQQTKQFYIWYENKYAQTRCDAYGEVCYTSLMQNEGWIYHAVRLTFQRHFADIVPIWVWGNTQFFLDRFLFQIFLCVNFKLSNAWHQGLL